jgi:hypothetical protein
MDEQELEAALSLLLEEMEGEIGDVGDIYTRLTRILNGMRAFGMPLPDDLVRLERELAEELAASKAKP